MSTTLSRVDAGANSTVGSCPTIVVGVVEGRNLDEKGRKNGEPWCKGPGSVHNGHVLIFLSSVSVRSNVGKSATTLEAWHL